MPALPVRLCWPAHVSPGAAVPCGAMRLPAIWPQQSIPIHGACLPRRRHLNSTSCGHTSSSIETVSPLHGSSSHMSASYTHVALKPEEVVLHAKCTLQPRRFLRLENTGHSPRHLRESLAKRRLVADTWLRLDVKQTTSMLPGTAILIRKGSQKEPIATGSLAGGLRFPQQPAVAASEVQADVVPSMQRLKTRLAPSSCCRGMTWHSR